LKIVILGSGSWGSALAQVLCDNHNEVTIWGIEEAEVFDLNQYHQNRRYFPEAFLPDTIKATTDLSVAKDADIVLLAVPSIALAEVCSRLNQVLEHPVLIINVAKGFHPVTHQRLSEVIANCIDPKLCAAIVSLLGPSHAEEVIQRLQTVICAVSEDLEAAKQVQYLFSNQYFRVYRNDDVIGSEICCALKNIIAIASGILSGIGLGDNARAALITRGLAEIKRYGLPLGAREETFTGLTGIGDLVVTCMSPHSRNYEAGYLIGSHNSSRYFWQNNTKTVEGVHACKIVYEEALSKGIVMPITEQVYHVLYKDFLPMEAVVRLMTRDLKTEF
jgi:glycerol-3-phosphate dehydrogenase (NAD(P)+)